MRAMQIKTYEITRPTDSPLRGHETFEIAMPMGSEVLAVQATPDGFTPAAERVGLLVTSQPVRSIAEWNPLEPPITFEARDSMSNYITRAFIKAYDGQVIPKNHNVKYVGTVMLGRPYNFHVLEVLSFGEEPC